MGQVSITRVGLPRDRTYLRAAAELTYPSLANVRQRRQP
jgi:hypothetical protein